MCPRLCNEMLLVIQAIIFSYVFAGKEIVQVVSRFRSKKMETTLTQIVQESDEKYPTCPLPGLPNLDGNGSEKPDIFTGDSLGRIKVSRGTQTQSYISSIVSG